MNERGFFSLVGICFLLIAAVFVKGLQEYESNYYGIAQNVWTESKLQNAADTALVMAVETLKKNPDLSLENPVLTDTVDGIHVEVYAKKNSLEFKKRYFNTATNYTDKPAGIPTKEGIILMSVASRDSDKMIGKIYRRSLGYFFTDENEKKYIHFMKSLNKD